MRARPAPCVRALPRQDHPSDCSWRKRPSPEGVRKMLLHGSVVARDDKRRIVVQACAPGCTLKPSALQSVVLRASTTLPTQPGFVSKEIFLSGRRLTSLGVDSSGDQPSQLWLHALVRASHIFCCVASSEFPYELARRFCNEMSLQWGDDGRPNAAVGGASASTSGSLSPRVGQALAFLHSAQALEFLLAQHADPQRVARHRRVNEIQRNAHEVSGIMSDSMSRMLTTADDLEALEDKSTTLLHRSQALHRSARVVRRTACCRKYKLRILLGCGCLFATAAVALVVLVLTHTVQIPGLPIPGGGGNGTAS